MKVIATVEPKGDSHVFSFKEQKSNFKSLLPEVNEEIIVIFNNLEIHTTVGDRQYRLNAPKKCKINGKEIKKLSYPELIKTLNLSSNQTVNFEIANKGNLISLVAIDQTENLLFMENGNTIKTIDEKISRDIMSRRGQALFRHRLLERYSYSCAISDCKTIYALEAAHITPHSEEQSYHEGNGLLLRADIHTLFDMHLISINPATGKVVVSNACCQQYNKYKDKPISPMPDKEYIEKHFKIFEENN
ncbi:HNH endonuclease signature motif containing protein [Pokkaliibacter sp. MBI-7]|uniref:HNH endonuclease n=1 Tax=Pokkaliibacter sp. MBI-7 TaxID=3040600 RepID=UPI002446F97F|nr:HNH endonuclease signature motif containing protein [Pokkaliibacter sp. MBI-7]MDH2432505.1 HNH endonuclease signature motif containing protein [Pokkaliibacter sp. MBI-7]